MARRNPQTMAKRAREFAVKEKRDLKRAKKAEAAAQKSAGSDGAPAEAPSRENSTPVPEGEPAHR
jgi:hypothetical protein